MQRDFVQDTTTKVKSAHVQASIVHLQISLSYCILYQNTLHLRICMMMKDDMINNISIEL
jgi:hypothetical protein